MQVSEEIKDFIKGYEKCRLQAYLPTKDDRPTIGYGMTFLGERPVQMGDVITQEQANKLFDIEVDHFATQVDNLVQIELTQSQFDALVSFAYNVGIANLKNSTLLKLLNAGNINEAADQFLRWNKQAGKVLNGLTKRRTAEREWFLR